MEENIGLIVPALHFYKNKRMEVQHNKDITSSNKERYIMSIFSTFTQNKTRRKRSHKRFIILIKNTKAFLQKLSMSAVFHFPRMIA